MKNIFICFAKELNFLKNQVLTHHGPIVQSCCDELYEITDTFEK